MQRINIRVRTSAYSFCNLNQNFRLRIIFSRENTSFTKKKRKERKKRKKCGSISISISIWKTTFQSMKLPLYFQRRFIHFKNILGILNEIFPYLYIDNYCEKHICTKKKVNIPLINSTSFLVIYLDRVSR